MNFSLFFLLIFCVIFQATKSIPSRLLYNFEVPNLKFLPSEDDVSSEEIQLRVPVVFFNTVYNQIFVNSNGFLSFQTEIPHFINLEFPLDYPIIAPFYSNVDISKTGTISFYESDDSLLLGRANKNVHENFLNAAEFKATSLFIATWNGVGYFNGKSDKTNTYQVVLITDGRSTYVEFLYPDNGLQWIQGTGDQSGLPDARAQVGFLSPNKKMHTLPGSATEQVKNLEKWTNMELPGQFIFKISEREILEPDYYQHQQKNNELYPLTCAEVPTGCHSKAICVDYKLGFCCKCADNSFIGNGKFCVKNALPLRVNGKLNGKLNGEKLENLDLQSYVVTDDGRAYTAISKIPESISSDIQTLQILGSVIAYLFAKPIRGAVNGFQKTGGLLNHTSTVTYLNSSQTTVHVTQKFLGLDVFDQLKVEIELQGDIPSLPPNTRVQIDEYEEQYTQTAKNLIQTSSQRAYMYQDENGQEITNWLKIEQSFEFTTCDFANNENETIGETYNLKVGRNFISYESREQIIRFGLSNKIVPIGDFDPCIEGKQFCGPNSACVVDGNNFECICNPGYQKIYSNNTAHTCEDINECQVFHECDPNAQCYNTIGSYECSCNPGFEGDGGKFCSPLDSCYNVTCLENSECVEINNVARCQCLAGFRGDGYNCLPVTVQSCNEHNNCSPYGICSIQPETKEYKCSCSPGYTGDGYYCSTLSVINEHYSTSTSEITTIIPNPTTTQQQQQQQPQNQILQNCVNGICSCPQGYSTDLYSQYCVVEDSNHYDGDCRTLRNCDYNARCGFDNVLQGYICACIEGYQGDGFTCYAKQQESCIELENCHQNAACSYDENLGRSRCVCNPGFTGDGFTCSLLTGVCRTNTDCAHTEDCIYQNNRYECVCKEGYSRDSQHICVPQDGETCGGGLCVENAECLYDDDVQTYYCSCKAGFHGDGITECKEKPIGCDTLNNCGLHATCKYEHDLLTYVCRCNPGFFGDGFSCFAEKNCHVDASMCDRNAQCYADANRRFICQCTPGYVGNGTVCKEVSRSEGNFLLLNQGWATHKIPMEANKRNPGRPIQIKTFQTAVGLDIDCLEGRVYWSDISLHAIRSSRYNGSDNINFITADVSSPEGLSIDWVSRNIYWTDSTLHSIEVANLDSKRRRKLFSAALGNPRGIAVHPQRGKVFWSDWDRKHPKIEWANADGTDRRIFLEGSAVSLPNALAIDYDTEQLCYSDAGTKKIECVQIDDSKQIQTIAVNCTYPFGIAISDKLVYWSDWISKKIERVDKFTLKRLTPLDIPAGGSGNKLFGLVAVPNRCPVLTNICQFSHCPDEHICLPDGKGSKSCLCAQRSDINEEPNCTI